MDKVLTVIVLAWLGALLGSFAGAQVWRLRARQLAEDVKDGEKVDKKELHNLSTLIRPQLSDRSECLHCHHQLAWYDLIPIVSWLMLGGRCRYCRRYIGSFELLIELGLAAVFVGSYLSWPTRLDTIVEQTLFVLWLVACALMATLFAYDAKWSLLPYKVNLGLIIISVIFAVLRFIDQGGVTVETLGSMAASVAIIAGLYYLFSAFGWAGLGDSILGIGLALFIGNWQLALLTLFLANLLGCVMLIPLYIRGALRRNVHIPFGPFLILGAIISMLYGDTLITWFFSAGNPLLKLLMV